MYLTQIDPKTGFLKVEEDETGILAIKAFRDILEEESLGLACLTAIALTADYKSPIKYYSEEDRPIKAMEEVTGNRKAFIWDQDLIQLALIKYNDLQFDPTIEEQRMHFQRKINKLNEMKESEKFFGTDKKDANEKPYRSPSIIAKELREINEDIEKHNNMIQGKDIYENSPVRGKYTLSRLEQKLNRKNNNFYLDIR